ncbi:hypothetical protein CSOJ01_06732 [Colletotrichum sojae]|uniref:Uncharacterized protein n=1 Tax=Colletotrichum sojae TaxID=2175907 RepID=A0A8H6JBA2_9PEZI|nr:hypothetical protein CSOJ01_06732 [Colletotrichum sojae]
MGSKAAFNSDLKHRNTTIFAQWFGVLAAVSFAVTSIVGVIGVAARGKFAWYPWTFTLLGALFFPVATIAFEVPHAFASFRSWVFNASLTSWPLLYLATAFGVYKPGEIVQSTVHILGCVAVASVMGLLRNVNSTKARICFYVAFSFAVDFSTEYPAAYGVASARELWFCRAPTLALSALALLGYAISLPLGHPFVFSRALGGSGVEPMTLLPLGAGPARSNIAGGRIMI